MTHNFTVSAQKLSYDVVVCGGGLSGVAAAVNAARYGSRTALIESGAELGGDITKGFVAQLLDPQGKGGFVREINDYLNQGGHTGARHGARYDDDGKKIPGTLIEPEYVKYFLDRSLRDNGVDVFYNSMAADVETENGKITNLLVATEAGNYALEAKIYIDATGNGQLAGMAGCSYEFGHPGTGKPQPASMGMMVTGVADYVTQTDSEAAKFELKRKIEESGIHVSANQVCLVRAATDGCWILAVNFQYDVPHDDILGISKATRDGRIECIEAAEALRAVPGFEKVSVILISSHLGIREGKRIKGKYFLTWEDITEGARFDDGICLVKFGIDVHAIEESDQRDHTKGQKTKPYHIPYRSLVPEKCDNLLLAGRCISGDFYAHSSYRMACDVIPTGEAAGYAAGICAEKGIKPEEVDGRQVSAYMANLGYEL